MTALGPVKEEFQMDWNDAYVAGMYGISEMTRASQINGLTT